MTRLETAPFTPRELVKADDRCDRCSAEAKVIATMLAGELLFCGHHARDLGKSLIDKAIHVHDPEGVLGLF
jgi:hypothetical protein